MNENVMENYYKSLTQKYNAVCFDIDGTITEHLSKNIDERAIEMIAKLLKKRIPIAFITGRGQTGLKDLINDLFIPLREKYGLSDYELRKSFVLTNDGSILYWSDNEISNQLFNSKKILMHDNSLNELIKINSEIVNIFNKYPSIKKYCDLSYSKVESDKIINIRIIFTEKNDDLLKNLLCIIKKIIIQKSLIELNVTTGIYEQKDIIQIGASKKDMAIKQAENIMGIPENSMLRIGDCGDIDGNDYDMLNCSQGFSVDKISGEIDKCFPIYTIDGKLLKNTEATIYLIDHAKILPTTCLEKTDKIQYTKEYAKIEKSIIRENNNIIRQFDLKIDQAFDTCNGVFDIYDKNSGSIIIPMYEWELIDDANPLKKFWFSFENGNLKYSMRDNYNYLLRGSKTYYYFLANRQSIDGKDYTSKENVSQWFNNYLGFFYNALLAVKSCNKFNIVDKKMILGILDNIRNALIILLNSQIMFNNEKSGILLNFITTNNSNYKEIYNLLLLNTEFMAKMSFDETFNLEKSEIINLLEKVILILQESSIDFEKNPNEINYSKIFRTYREIDSFIENYIAMYTCYEKNNEINSVCGLCYGGIELPVIYKYLNPKISDVCILKFDNKTIGYNGKQLLDIRNFSAGGYIKSDGIINSNDIMILDDNILTGKTIQLALDVLYDLNVNVKNVGIVRYPSVNRIDQMFMDNHGAVDYRLFFDYIIGLSFPSPYSWRDENYLNAYEDSLGVFDLNRKKIIDCLIKNHDYSKISEVNEFVIRR